MTTVWNFLTGSSSPEVDKTKLNRLRNNIRRSLQNSVISETCFLPESDIQGLVTPDKVKLLLPNAKPELVDFICNDAKKLFLTASLHHGNLQDIMGTFKDHGMTDEHLPIRDLTSEDKYCEVHTEGLQRVCSHEKALEAFHRWDAHDVWNFYNDQWMFCAPMLSMECSSQEFHPKHILPFIEKGKTQKDGHFSTVFEAVIHPGHQIGRGSLKPNINQTRVALKELKSLSEPNYNVHVSWLNEANALFQIAELRHKHLISQATAFKQGERRFIVLEWANGGTLRDIWQNEPHDRFVLDGDKVMRVLEELTGIASALSKLHGTNTRTRTARATSADLRKKNPPSRSRTILPQGQGDRLTVPKIRFEGVSSDDDYDSSDYGEEQHWRHGDLKPDNILHFRDEMSSWLGTLKIADLGLAKQHAFATTQRQDPTQQKYTTSHYEAPEVITTMNSRVPRSRRYDIWSMGCIIFEYTIWLLYGYEEGLKSFYNEGKDIDAYRETLYFTADLSTRQAQVSNAARRWIDHILEVDPECNRATPSVIKDLVILVRDKLLVIDLPKENMSQDDIKRCRASADDLERALQKIKRLAADDEHKGGTYLSSGKSRHGILAPRPQKVRRQSFLSTSSGSASKPSNLVHWRQIGGDIRWLTGSDPILYYRLKLDYRSDEPMIRETMATMRSKSQQCALHSLVYRSIPPSAYNSMEVVHVRRSDSLLVMDKSKIPLLSLSKISDNSKRNHLHSDDIYFGLPKLFPPKSAPFYDLLIAWIQDCDLHHPQCHPADRSRAQPPTRLIEVGQVDGGSPKVFLRETVNVQCPTGGELKYIALSHPWGNGKEHDHFCTTNNNLDGRLSAGIEIKAFPNTFRHAIEVTRALGVPYLWIDSLCIVQGPGGDFDTEAKRMELVFSSAYCVIAASRANGTSSGFLWERPEREVVRLDGYLAHDSVYACEAIDNFQHDVIEGALNRRGWVLQERALAPRTIYFTENQTYWECGQGVRCEKLTRLTKQYSKLEFTKIHDRPIAIAGLEQRLVSAFKTEGGYGVFNGAFFGRSLLWTRDTQQSDRLKLIDFPRDQKFRVPTWSWTAYEGPITYFDIPFDHVRWTYNTAEGRIQSPWTTMESDSTSFSLHTGELNGRIDLTAPAREIFDLELAEMQGKVIYDEGKSPPGVRKLCVIVGREKSRDEGCKMQDLEYYALIIAPFDDPSDGFCRRIGVGRLLESWIDFANPELRVHIS
ncbi:serine threonine kinase [Fusarium subglutinans]|uniref:Serine threonine kinase n=1 Tax=Gibberella subglutinans TaxID=42677 RepID=A0A8H5L4K6_GIBSU|nr:serine threonine kinase [Fusarium subglutinans]KAF5584629.1 serine threonine kinase [Fusarium subglutinans]